MICVYIYTKKLRLKNVSDKVYIACRFLEISYIVSGSFVPRLKVTHRGEIYYPTFHCMSVVIPYSV
jgi:hypothetical protein